MRASLVVTSALLVVTGAHHHVRQAEAIFGALGARRTEALQLQPLQQRVLREKGLQLLKVPQGGRDEASDEGV